VPATAGLDAGTGGGRRALLAGSSLAAAGAVVTIFLIRAAGTLLAGHGPVAARATTLVHLVSSAVIIFFLAVFHREYPVRRGSSLAGATSVLIGACGAGALVVAGNFLHTIGVPVVEWETSAAIATVVSLLTAFASLMFFTALCSQLDDDDRGRFARAVRFAVAGALVSAVAHAGVFALYATRLMRPELVPLASPLLRAASVVVSAFVVATLVVFLVALRDELSRRHS